MDHAAGFAVGQVAETVVVVVEEDPDLEVLEASVDEEGKVLEGTLGQAADTSLEKHHKEACQDILQILLEVVDHGIRVLEDLLDLDHRTAADIDCIGCMEDMVLVVGMEVGWGLGGQDSEDLVGSRSVQTAC